MILSFESDSAGGLSFPCDSCDLWQHNVRSIALAMQALRAVDRYGVTRRAEQYRGWARLPAPRGDDDAPWPVPTTIGEARIVVSEATEQFGKSDADLLRIAKDARVRNHPDHGGDGRLFRVFNAAVDLLAKVAA
ncbi:hypothetical protein [Crateriforma conspicua]|uniref:hypothetical protein n=1 Tax=Crateriforma conspicua TaxID=2527996 RepID=UPI0013FCF785|nr:hypothetical protein [Crateriforma conspicua]